MDACLEQIEQITGSDVTRLFTYVVVGALLALLAWVGFRVMVVRALKKEGRGYYAALVLGATPLGMATVYSFWAITFKFAGEIQVARAANLSGPIEVEISSSDFVTAALIVAAVAIMGIVLWRSGRDHRADVDLKMQDGKYAHKETLRQLESDEKIRLELVDIFKQMVADGMLEEARSLLGSLLKQGRLHPDDAAQVLVEVLGIRTSIRLSNSEDP